MKKVSFVRNMDVTSPRDDVNRALGCVSLRWSTDDNIDRTLAEKDQNFGAQVLKTSEWFSVESLCSIKRTIHGVRENFSVAPYSGGYHGLLDASIVTDFIKRTANFCSKRRRTSSISRRTSKTKGSVIENQSFCGRPRDTSE